MNSIQVSSTDRLLERKPFNAPGSRKGKIKEASTPIEHEGKIMIAVFSNCSEKKERRMNRALPFGAEL